MDELDEIVAEFKDVFYNHIDDLVTDRGLKLPAAISVLKEALAEAAGEHMKPNRVTHP